MSLSRQQVHQICFSLLFAVALFVFANPSGAIAQEEMEEKEEAELTRKHSLAVALGHIHVAKGFKDGNKQWLALPSWALDYTYRFNPRWSAGLQNEIIVTDFEVESGEGEGLVITRTSPFASIAVVGYRPLENLTVFAGAGGEFAKEENFAMIRFGVEPSWEIGERLELLASGVYDIKINGYDSFGITFGVAYAF